MRIVRDSREMKRIAKSRMGECGFVATMGALHEGHISLIERAAEENDNVVVSVFVNPTQFLEGEDLERYPRREKEDTEICAAAGVDILYMPQSENIYFPDEMETMAPKIGGYILEGAGRPGHFDGVLRIVMKLLNIVSPDRAYFGKKDAQQLILIERMVRDYFMDIEIVGCETVRESDGLALSSRNVYLDEEQRRRALSISRALRSASELVDKGERDAESLISAMREILQKGVDEVEYVAVTDRGLNMLEEIKEGESLILVAARVGETRLIDNLWL